MPYTANVHTVEELAHIESPHEVIIKPNNGTDLFIKCNDRQTLITLPFGNKFDIVDGAIIIHSTNPH